MNALDQAAQAVLEKNSRGSYTVPTARLYPYQWNWDSLFTAWGLARFDIERAWEEIEALFSVQWPNGMVPHIVFWKTDPEYFPGPEIWGGTGTPPTSGISQPPVAATLIRKVYEANPEAGRTHLAALYPKLRAWHRWWHEARCAGGPAAIVHPWESGRDNCPDWDIGMANVATDAVGAYDRRDTGVVDAAMRPTKTDYDRYLAILAFGREHHWEPQVMRDEGPFLMADPAITFILIRAHRDLAAIARELGGDPSEPERWERALVASLPEIWNDALGIYDARDLRSGAFAGNLGSGAFLAWLAGPVEPALEARLMQAWDAVRFGLPSADPASPGFSPKHYWRGPMWPQINALVAIGLADSGRPELAERLRRETRAAIETGGFYEHFDPTDGSGGGGPDFSWTAAVWLAWAGRDEQGGQA